jgi:hypothetical protein
MNLDELLLVAAVAAVGVLHTIVPDHWAPIALIARQRGWSRSETARAAFQAGLGHVGSTLVIAVIVWFAGVAVAASFGQIIDTLASIALVALGGWIAVGALLELRAEGHGHSHPHGQTREHGHSHSHNHDFLHLPENEIHGPELQRIPLDEGELDLSIYETGAPPRFRLTGPAVSGATVETLRPEGGRQLFRMVNRGTYWESQDEIPEPHGFAATISLERFGELRQFHTEFIEHAHGHDHGHNHDKHDSAHGGDGELTLLTRHVHAHRHAAGPTHAHWHQHPAPEAHEVSAGHTDAIPLHTHAHQTSFRTALLLILGSSPMIEGIPAFFAAGKYGAGLIIVMSVVFAISTVVTYVVLCVVSTAGLDRLHLGPLERYGEVLSGAFIAVVGIVFWVWPVL